MALVTSIFLGVVSMAHGADQRLVTCQQPVNVRFIANQGQVKPAFSEEVAPGQKHWWSYGCKLSDHIVAGPDTRPADTSEKSAEDRKLMWHMNWMWNCDSYNETAEAKAAYHAAWGWSANCTVTTTAAPAGTTAAATATAAPTGSTSATPAVNTTGNTNGTAAATTTTTTAGKVKEAEVSGCVATAMSSVVAGLSLSLPLVMGDDAQTKKKDLIDVLMPCSSLVSPMVDLDGDGQLDCKMTKEQSHIATVIPALQGDWKVATSHTVAHGRRLASPKHRGDNITFDDGAMCVDISTPFTSFSHQKEKIELFQSILPTAIANVAGFTHNGKLCEEDNCEASMWSFDLTYPSSTCTPELPGWVRPCTAKLMPNGQLVLIRGESATPGTIAQRPPLMEDIESVHDVLPFANGLAAAAQSEFDVLVLQKEGHGRHKAFVAADVDANGALSFSEFESVINKLPEHCADAF